MAAVKRRGPFPDRARSERYDAQLGAEAVGDGNPSAGDQNHAAGGNFVAARVGLLMVIAVLSLMLLLTMLFVDAFSRSGSAMTG